MRLLAKVLIVTLGVVVVGLGGVYIASEWKLRRTYEAPLTPFTIKANDIAEGRRLAVLVGCWAGCHGKEGEGRNEQVPGVFSITAPTLSDVLPQYSDAELVRLIRYGVKRDGRSTLIMSSDTFFPLGDTELANIIAHLRAQPAQPPIPRERRLTLRARLGLVIGEFRTSAEQVDRAMPRWGEMPQRNASERGRYLASITCAECHGLDFNGEASMGSPSLAMVSGYTPEQFERLLRTGEPTSGRDLGLMSWVARNAFVEFTDTELDDLYTFLTEHFAAEASPLAQSASP